MAWLTPNMVAAHKGIIPTGDTRLETVTDAAMAWVERTRPDVDYTQTVPNDVLLGATIFAALLYDQAGSPSGLASMDDLGTYDDLGPSMVTVYRLVGSRRPVVR